VEDLLDIERKFWTEEDSVRISELKFCVRLVVLNLAVEHRDVVASEHVSCVVETACISVYRAGCFTLAVV